MRDSRDGFVIAEKDLKLRGLGEVLGTRQTDLAQFRVADLERDGDLMESVRNTSRELIERSSEYAEPLINCWFDRGEDYAHV